MKQIINGKKYDTETAHLCAKYQYLGPGDSSWYREELYCKRTGEYFLFGEGGPSSKYSRSCGLNEWEGDCKIIPMTWFSARKWAEAYLSDEEYEQIFGEVEEDDEKKVVGISMSVTAINTAKRAASQKGMSLSRYLEYLVMGE